MFPDILQLKYHRGRVIASGEQERDCLGPFALGKECVRWCVKRPLHMQYSLCHQTKLLNSVLKREGGREAADALHYSPALRSSSLLMKEEMKSRHEGRRKGGKSLLS